MFWRLYSMKLVDAPKIWDVQVYYHIDSVTTSIINSPEIKTKSQYLENHHELTHHFLDIRQRVCCYRIWSAENCILRRALTLTPSWATSPNKRTSPYCIFVGIYVVHICIFTWPHWNMFNIWTVDGCTHILWRTHRMLPPPRPVKTSGSAGNTLEYIELFSKLAAYAVRPGAIYGFISALE